MTLTLTFPDVSRLSAAPRIGPGMLVAFHTTLTASSGWFVNSSISFSPAVSSGPPIIVTLLQGSSYLRSGSDFYLIYDNTMHAGFTPATLPQGLADDAACTLSAALFDGSSALQETISGGVSIKWDPISGLMWALSRFATSGGFLASDRTLLEETRNAVYRTFEPS